MENGRVTIYDVAERAGVSIATVSRAMSGGSISAKSRQKVQEAIEALHYQEESHRTGQAGWNQETGVSLTCDRKAGGSAMRLEPSAH